MILQAVANAAIVGTFIVYYRQLRAMQGQLAAAKDASQNQNLISIIQLLQAAGLPEDRKVLTEHLKGVPFADWRDSQKDSVRRVCNTYDIAARLIKHSDQIVREAIIDGWGGSMKACYIAALPMIEKEQADRPERWREFVNLATRLQKCAA